MKSLHCPFRSGVMSLVALMLGHIPTGQAAMATVNVADNFFSPSVTSINANDSVRWTWVGFGSHSTTSSSNPRLWDSGIHGNGFAFTNTFGSAGNFPYFCVVHPFMTGSVNVAAPTNSPPTVTITNPSSGTILAAPATIVIKASATDNDGSVTNVKFFSNSTLLGSVPSAPYNLTVNNLAANTYTLTAVATDNAGATNSSAVTISVVTPVPVVITNPQRLSATRFRFDYTANTGLRYAVERSGNLSNFTAININTAAVSSVTFTDNAAANGPNFYRVGRLPNP